MYMAVETEVRIRALAAHLGIDPEEITECHGETTFEVQSHTVKDGTSPEKAKELVALLRKGLDTIPLIRNSNGAVIHDPCIAWDLAHVRALGYKLVEGWLRTNAPPELFKVGIHDLVNTLYFLCPETDGDNQHAKDHRDTIREAFRGEEPTDRRTSRRTSNGEYLVLTDDEADEAWDQALESYIDDCMEIPEGMEPYFDRERWKEDAKVDGRGHSLSSYDGCEHEVTVKDDDGADVDLYIYRTN